MIEKWCVILNKYLLVSRVDRKINLPLEIRIRNFLGGDPESQGANR